MSEKGKQNDVAYNHGGTKDMDNLPVHNHELKLRRAVQHLTTLDEQIYDWLDGAYRYVAEIDPQSGKKHIRVKQEVIHLGEYETAGKLQDKLDRLQELTEGR